MPWGAAELADHRGFHQRAGEAFRRGKEGYLSPTALVPCDDRVFAFGPPDKVHAATSPQKAAVFGGIGRPLVDYEREPVDRLLSAPNSWPVEREPTTPFKRRGPCGSTIIPSSSARPEATTQRG